MIVFIFISAAGTAYLHWALIGWAVVPGLLSVYVAAYLATLLAAVVQALWSKEREPIWCAVILAVYFLAGHVLWGVAASLEARGIEHLVFAAAMVALFRSRAAMLIAGCFIAMFAVDLATMLGAMPSAAARPRGFVVWSHPDVLALLGHAANITLGLWSEGGAISSVLRRPAFSMVKS